MDAINAAVLYNPLTPLSSERQIAGSQYTAQQSTGSRSVQAEFIPAYADENDLAARSEERRASASVRPEIRAFLETADSSPDATSGRYINIQV